ncbi:DNA-binding protein [Candidatus Falkowbacteria bacterium]|nr:DNA-binding protein [Candidatus Falkowbacteria bacterium]
MTETDLIHLPRVPAELRALGVPVSYQKAWRLVTEGALPSCRDGGKVLVPLSDLKAWAQAQRAGA